MRDVFIVSAVRTPVGRKNGSLSQMHPVAVASIPLSAVVKRVDLDPAAVEDPVGEPPEDDELDEPKSSSSSEPLTGTTIDSPPARSVVSPVLNLYSSSPSPNVPLAPTNL